MQNPVGSSLLTIFGACQAELGVLSYNNSTLMADVGPDARGAGSRLQVQQGYQTWVAVLTALQRAICAQGQVLS
jgi:hypothetical protein